MLKSFILAAIKCFQATRLLRAPACRFYPSCSEYLQGCVETQGVMRGLYLGGIRLTKCHPLHPGGVDLVPEIISKVANVSKVRGSH